MHRVAAGLLVADGLVLLGHRHPQRRHYPDCWDAVGGHIEPGETPMEALVRECREEIGVVVTRARPVDLPVTMEDLELHAFVVEAWEGTPANLEPDEHDAIGWFGADEVPGLRLAHPALGELTAGVVRPG